LLLRFSTLFLLRTLQNVSAAYQNALLPAFTLVDGLFLPAQRPMTLPVAFRSASPISRILQWASFAGFDGSIFRVLPSRTFAPGYPRYYPIPVPRAHRRPLCALSSPPQQFSTNPYPGPLLITLTHPPLSYPELRFLFGTTWSLHTNACYFLDLRLELALCHFFFVGARLFHLSRV